MNEAPPAHAEFEAFFGQHYAKVYAYARRRSDDHTARDIASETFLIAWRRREESLPLGLPWLYRTASFLLANSHRSQHRQLAVQEKLKSYPLADAADTADAVVEADLVYRALAQLPPKQRELVLLTLWEGLAVAEAAAVVGCSVGAAHVRLHRARATLRSSLGKSA